MLFVVGGRGGQAAADAIHRECRAKQVGEESFHSDAPGDKILMGATGQVVMFAGICNGAFQESAAGVGALCSAHTMPRMRRAPACACLCTCLQVPCSVVAVPKSIDNDMLLFDKTFGCARV